MNLRLVEKQVKEKLVWSDIKKEVSNFSRDGLLGLIKDLFELSEENKTFLAARFRTNTSYGIEKYKDIIIEQFFPGRGFGKLKLSIARKAINDYKKATSDYKGVFDLMLTYIEYGTKFTLEFGDIDEPFYNSMESMLGQFFNLIKSEQHQKYYSTFKERIEKLRNSTYNKIGWGYSDYIDDVYLELKEFFSNQEPAPAQPVPDF